MCSSLLQPLQPYLTGTLSRWLNFPVSGSLEDDAYKATNILRTFMAASRLEPERQLPASVLRGARGLALMSVLRVGAGWSATVGTGLVVSRQLDGSWSPPCAAACYGVGWGAQIGGESPFEHPHR
ncbi:SH3 domain-containing protein [Monoraphidium neglectum]|uniref:SH3 domain-containing protein n=1 Tax=Monoraphidium neglectum TaxID=145388 RepID=A0A0D2K780_9CHLO|nr:SH3 domain-containing protein [Monoraphidium neglectum]KIZ06123.1 SH3 domain-containing protein [Monoraphidium neglectum]|eukprot:XP_013905142.1 SH3 domain-containing protein [Monoraphidium neglectum]